MLSSLSQFITIVFTVQLTLADILCYVAIIPFVVLIVVYFADVYSDTEYLAGIICSILQQVMFVGATIIRAITESTVHILPIILSVIWLAMTVVNAYRYGREKGTEKQQFGDKRGVRQHAPFATIEYFIQSIIPISLDKFLLHEYSNCQQLTLLVPQNLQKFEFQTLYYYSQRFYI